MKLTVFTIDQEKRGRISLSEREQIEEMNEKISSLKGQRDKLEAEASEWAKKRDKRNEQFKKLRDEIYGLKRERDEANEEARGLKLKRNEAKTRVQQKIQELRTLREELRVAIEKKPTRSLLSLQEQFDSIEWKIQTIPMSMQEENEYVEQARQIELQLNIYRKLQRLKQKTLATQAEIKTLRAEGQSYHEKLTKTAQKSQGRHEKMLSKIEESKKVKAEADSLHQTFAQTKGKIMPIQEEIEAILDRMRHLKNEARQREELEKGQNERAILSELEKRAREKLKRREKLTWEEFQRVAEKGIDTGDSSQ
jgi:uncharacterized coiled-coil DUF342 family protein